jgi:hypothetical protein
MLFTGTFDRKADVVVIGLGAAGAVTAITAHDEGAEVLVIEKQARDRRRPNSRFSGGTFICPADKDGARHYMTQLYHHGGDLYETDPAVIAAWAEETSRNYDWLTEKGGKAVEVGDHGEHDQLEGYESIRLFKPDMNVHPGGKHRGWGYGLFKFLNDHVEERGITVMYETRALWLLTNADREVIGVQVRQGGKVLNIEAGKAVVMTCGGFEFNAEMKLQNLRIFPTYFYGNPENTGDGVRMAQEIGADLWHMNSCAARFIARFPHPDYPGGTPVDFWGIEALNVTVAGFEGYAKEKGGTPQAESRPGRDEAPALPMAQMQVKATHSLPGCVVTDRFGRRFTNEVYRSHILYYELINFDSHRMVYPKVPSWWFFDERRINLGKITPTRYGPTGPLAQVPWSTDNRPEVEKDWIKTAGSLAELAAMCGMDGEALAATVRQYNGYCRDGHDPDHGRPPATLVPLDSPPFYAVQLWPGGPNTQGGPRRDPDARIVNVAGEPIRRLYSAGEFGSVYGMLYPSGGGNIAECLAFGRIAGRNAAAEKSR